VKREKKTAAPEIAPKGRAAPVVGKGRGKPEVRDRRTSGGESVERLIDAEEFSELVQWTRKIVYGVAYRFMGNHSDADDVTQQAFLQAYRKRASFRRGTDFGAWVKRIASNMAIDEKRRRKRRREVVMPDPGILEIPRTAEPDSPEPGREVKALTADFLNRLPASQRVVLVLRLFENKSTGEIAEILGIPQGTVWWRLHRARKTLKQLFLPHLQEAGERTREGGKR
jgi:RNA polymerase sigma-70 factor (ECF subfamily)